MLATKIIVLSALAFVLWLALLPAFSRVKMPLAGVIAAIASWAIATMSLAWTLHVVRWIQIHWTV